MKKLFVLSLAVILTLAFASVSMASTIGVNVNKGWSVSVEKADTDADEIEITGNYGISDQLMLSVGFVTEIDAISLGVRYEFAENAAINFKYYTYDINGIDFSDYYLDVRGKANLSDKIALTGKLGYIRFEDDFDTEDGFEIVGLAEYSFNDFVTANLGASYTEIENSDITKILLGFEFYPTENLTLWVDYSFDADDSDNDCVGIGIEFAF